MNAPLTRRALLGATAAFGAVGLLTLAKVSMPASDPDAPLLRLIAEHLEAEGAWEAACRTLEAARDSASAAYPQRPAALTATSADVMLYGLAPSGRWNKPGGRAWIYFNMDDLDRLRAMEPVTSLAWDEQGRSLPPVPNPAGEARRREVIEIYDRWLVEKAAVDRLHGLTAAEAVEGPLCATMEVAEAAVESYVPMTLPGLKAKAMWALARCDRDDAVLLFVQQLVGDAAPTTLEQDADDMQAAA